MRLSVPIVVVFAVLSLVVSGCGGSSDTSSSDKASAEVVRATERQRLRALLGNDLDTAQRLHADDFELINPLGETVPREAYIDSGEPSRTRLGSRSRRSGCVSMATRR